MLKYSSSWIFCSSGVGCSPRATSSIGPLPQPKRFPTASSTVMDVLEGMLAIASIGMVESGNSIRGLQWAEKVRCFRKGVWAPGPSRSATPQHRCASRVSPWRQCSGSGSVAKRDAPGRADAAWRQAFRDRCGCCRNAPSHAPHGFPGNVAALRIFPGWGWQTDGRGEGEARARAFVELWMTAMREDNPTGAIDPMPPLAASMFQRQLAEWSGRQVPRKSGAIQKSSKAANKDSVRPI